MGTSTPINSINSLDLSAGNHVKGLPLGEHTFLAVTSFGQLQAIMRNPRDLQPNVKRSGYDADLLEEEAALHELVQRALTGAKRSNVPKYAAYIHELVTGRSNGVLPPIHTWSADRLDLVQNGADTYLLVPQSEHLLAIDGETQLAAHFEVPRLTAGSPEEKKQHQRFPLAMVVHHGIDGEHARQYFHDLNILAVKPNTSLGLSMNTKDPIMQVVGNLELRIPMLNGKVEKQARQLPKKSQKVMSVQSLRQFTINTMLGMAGVQYGARPAPVPEDVELRRVEEVARGWLDKYLGEFAPAVIDRENTLAGSAPVLAAIGAIGHSILEAEDRDRAMAQQLDSLRQVNWHKGNHWSGIAGKFTEKGTFSVGGTKEVAYAVYNVLTDPSNAGYARVRTTATPVAALEPDGRALAQV